MPQYTVSCYRVNIQLGALADDELVSIRSCPAIEGWLSNPQTCSRPGLRFSQRSAKAHISRPAAARMARKMECPALD
jgi:hypothetical protein